MVSTGTSGFGADWLAANRAVAPLQSVRHASKWPYALDRADTGRESNTSAFERLLDSGRDDLIASALDAAPSLVVARLLLHRVECLSECVSGRAAGWDCARLFCVPAILEFPAALPASQIDAALAHVIDERGRLHVLRDVGLDASSASLFSNSLEFGDIARLPLSAIRAGAHALLHTRCQAVPPPHVFVRIERPQHRSRMFLRHLIGIRDAKAGARPARCPWLEKRLRQLLPECEATVRVFYTGSLLDPTYTAMWLYQSRCLKNILSHRSGNRSPLEASVASAGTRLRPELRLCFRESRWVRDTTYLLRCRPLEDCDRCVMRVARVLRSAGVRVSRSPGPLHEGVEDQSRKSTIGLVPILPM